MWLSLLSGINPAEATPPYRFCVCDENYVQQERNLTTKCQVVNDLFVIYTARQAIPSAEACIRSLKQPGKCAQYIIEKFYGEG